MLRQGNKRHLKQPYLVAISIVVGLAIVLLLSSGHLSSISYALYLFGVLIHEIGHSVAALLTQGHVHGFVVHAGSGGYALISGGSSAFVLPAGYLGCAVSGSLMLYLSNRYRWADGFAILIGFLLVFFTLLFGRAEENGAMTAHYVAAGFGGILMWFGLKRTLWLNMLLVNIISTLTALQGVKGAFALYLNSEQWHHNDAVMFSEAVTPWLTGNQVALIWAIMAICLFALAFYFGILKTVFHGGKRWWHYIDPENNTVHKE